MELLSKTKWRIIEELSKGDKSPTDLARIMRVSIPSVYLQLVELERMELVKKIGGKSGKTRPYQQYSLGEGFLFFVKAMPNETVMRRIEMNDNIKLHFRIWSLPQQEFHEPVENFLWQLKPKLSNIDSIAVFGSVARGDAKEDSDVDVLILCKKDMKIDASMINRKMFVPQVFVTEDFENSIKRGSKFADEVLRNVIIIYDKEDILKNAKRRAG